MRVVIALGGNALLRRGQPMTVEAQRENVAAAARAVGEIAREHSVVVTHGNGPQVGLLALQSEAVTDVPSYPLDVLGAESEGMIGYLLEQEIGYWVPRQRLATLLTQVVVDAGDPAFARPTKFVGPVYDETAAVALARERGWQVARDGEQWRRVVASPEPVHIVELDTIRLLVEHGVTVICVGGGGIPVTLDSSGRLRGVEAVIDKDLAAAVLADQLDADALLLLTDVDGIYAHWGTPAPRRIESATPGELRGLDLPAGSMGPKAEAACRFTERAGRMAAIGSMGDARALLNGEAGTVVRADVGTFGPGPTRLGRAAWATR